MREGTLLVNDFLMFIGGGSAGTAGGIKVTTFALLGFVILAEIRGEPSVHALGRRLPAGVQRQALTVALLSVGAVAASTLLLLALTPFSLDQVLFEVVSAFATVGLSTGITADLGAAGHAILTVLMFAGRLGPITLASALALRERTRRYELPEERPIVG
jgi:Trk-type K+ transport system membrane component